MPELTLEGYFLRDGSPADAEDVQQSERTAVV
jgi:hypothetical protein